MASKRFRRGVPPLVSGEPTRAGAHTRARPQPGLVCTPLLLLHPWDLQAARTHPEAGGSRLRTHAWSLLVPLWREAEGAWGSLGCAAGESWPSSLGGSLQWVLGCRPQAHSGPQSSPTSQPARAWPGGLSGHLGWPGPSFNQSTRAKWVSRQTDRPTYTLAQPTGRGGGALSSPATAQRPLPHSAPHQTHLLGLPQIWEGEGCVLSSFESSINPRQRGTTGTPGRRGHTFLSNLPPLPSASGPRGQQEGRLEGAAG